ncbi:zinc metalloprotease [Flavobacterium hercynium]|uniref:Uncharacterized protein n=1 Tax=Flavobacterium hercynium TaxID=387094 RepID=A0A226HC33_9FLAO|nr:hypothetical protein [Flavobacterium hercynium]OXA91644.1 hypothetical protein B0A66_10905 [Flavobacterium hercynium]SMP27664.1 hypothetical protein SAMN06265346_110172 [Flavobacterium hercynium]
MSRIRIVGGSITKTSKGATILEALDGNLTMSAAKQVILDGGENGITHHEYVPPKKKEEDKTDEPKILDAKCIVQFRPNGSWKGEFGFDWFRIGDTRRQGDVNYETLVGRHYDKELTDTSKQIVNNGNKWSTNFKADPQPAEFSRFNRIDQLKELYGVYEYSLENDSSGSPINKKYYKPVLALFAREADPLRPRKFIETGIAQLDLYIQFEKQGGTEIKPSKLIFEMDGVLMDENHPLVSIDRHTILQNKLRNKIENIEITCKAEFAEDKEIKVWAISVDKAGNQTAKLLAGVLKMIAPAKKATKNILLVLVNTSKGTGSSNGLDILKRNLKQALIKTNIVTKAMKMGVLESVKIDLSISANNVDNKDFNSSFQVDVKDSEYSNIGNREGLDDFLKDTLERDYPGQFQDYFKLFFLANGTDIVFDKDKLLTGYTAGYSSLKANFGVMFKMHNEYTIAHECLHGLGLRHSFFGVNLPNEISFCYQAQTTDNIMDYSHNLPTPIPRITTWYWQWKILNRL